MKVNEVFKSLQGEGKYAGMPCVFVRLSGCTRSCSFCDTKYHTEGKEMSPTMVADEIFEKAGNNRIVVWTGGEPTLQADEIFQVMALLEEHEFQHHLETNGDRIIDYNLFSYVCFSPKDNNAYKNVCGVVRLINGPYSNHQGLDFNIKVVTDTVMNKEMLEPIFGLMLMPLSTYDDAKDKEIEQKVWNYCAENDIPFCLRQHVRVWGAKKGI